MIYHLITTSNKSVLLVSNQNHAPTDQSPVLFFSGTSQSRGSRAGFAFFQGCTQPASLSSPVNNHCFFRDTSLTNEEASQDGRCARFCDCIFLYFIRFHPCLLPTAKVQSLPGLLLFCPGATFRLSSSGRESVHESSTSVHVILNYTKLVSKIINLLK